MNAFALPRLLARPAALWILFPLFWAVAVPYMTAHDHGAPFGVPGAGGPGGGWQFAAWRLALLVPAVVGFAAAAARLELQHATFSWMLPALRRSLVAGVIVMAIPLAAACAVAVARSAASGAVPVGAAAFALALFAFAAAFALPDAALPRWLRYTPALLLLVAAFRAEFTAGVVAAAPWAVAALATTAATALLLAPLSEDAARSRHFRWSTMAPHRTVLYWASQPTTDVRWTQSLATERLLPWLRAITYESRHPRLSLLGFMLLMAAVAGAAAYIVGEPVQLLILAGIWLVQGRPWMNNGVFYPLSRSKRADIMTAALAAEAATLGFMLTLAAVVVARLSVAWPGPLADDSASVSWAAAVGMTVAFAPLAQWSRIVWPGTSDRNGLDVRRFAWLFAFYLPAILLTRVVTGHEVATVAGASLAIAIIGYAVLWAAARRYYERADLVGRSA